MTITRRQFTLGALLAAGTAGLPVYAGAQGKKTIAVLFDGLYSPFWVAGLDVIKQDLERRGYQMVQAISDQDDNRQLEQVRAMLARKVDGIIIVQTDSNAVIPAIRAANQAKVPMVHFNRPPAKTEAFSVAVVADNRSITNATLDHMVKVAREKGGKYKAAIMIGDLGDPNAIGRRDGFFDVVDKNKDIIEVVARIPTEWNADIAFSGLTNAFQANPDINFLFTSSDFLFPQIVQVMKTRDKFHPIGHPDHVIFGGFDGDATAYELLKDKYLDADGVQDLFKEADLAINAIIDLQGGKTVERVLLDPGFAIHQANLEQSRERMWGYTVYKQKNG
ncbi:sugar ABC transporter substrate-binding protein [Cellulomonas rhizosphaerae]|uniref:Sugar ABC transporter substrate-binding protein n=1 Tax=Cellulomonas rhizosphaerae TaxID=2293719 RepID=A0A413RRX4_9CELL|nr:sugar ABC transporter substrate-binding protein [Cellulomonas rhizosphaerae]RHA44670.1 sugar ABC transporter substrate-binding protein [Cellulomonas rhizosphaerae]